MCKALLVVSIGILRIETKNLIIGLHGLLMVL
jgi:hypothetical protein